jgi:hypothetical protein
MRSPTRNQHVPSWRLPGSGHHTQLRFSSAPLNSPRSDRLTAATPPARDAALCSTKGQSPNRPSFAAWLLLGAESYRPNALEAAAAARDAFAFSTPRPPLATSFSTPCKPRCIRCAWPRRIVSYVRWNSARHRLIIIGCVTRRCQMPVRTRFASIRCSQLC